MKLKIVLLAACALCLDWTRLIGVVKALNLKDNTVTIENRDGDLLTVPVDYQVKIVDKHGDLLEIKRLALDQKITLTRTPMEQPKEDPDALAPPQPEPSQHGL